MQFVKFMTSSKGRAARVIAGLVVLTVGLAVVQGTLGLILALIALVPIAGGVFDFCLASVALGYPFRGTDARQKLAGK
jgi:uncharacterized protein (DUF697 family)